MLLSLLVVATAQAEVYRSVDANGVVHYTDKPQSPTDKPVALPPLQTYRAGTLTPAVAGDSGAPANKPAVPASVTITEPAAEQTFRGDSDRNVPVSVNASLDQGAGLVFYLDGTAQNKTPTPSTAFLMTNVERGQHSISVALVDAAGKEEARSPSVTFYMMPSTAKH